MKTLKLKNYFFIGSQDATPIHAWFAKQMLHGQASRNRTRFMRLLEDRVNEIEKVRIELLEKYSEKKTEEIEVTKDGKKVMESIERVVYVIGEFNPETGKIDEKDTTDPTPMKTKRYKIIDQEGFNKAWEEYTLEDLVLDVTPQTSEAIYGARDILNDTKDEFAGRGATLYDEWCEAFAQIKDSEDKEEKKSKKK